MNRNYPQIRHAVRRGDGVLLLTTTAPADVPLAAVVADAEHFCVALYTESRASDLSFRMRWTIDSATKRRGKGTTLRTTVRKEAV